VFNVQLLFSFDHILRGETTALTLLATVTNAVRPDLTLDTTVTEFQYWSHPNETVGKLLSFGASSHSNVLSTTTFSPQVLDIFVHNTSLAHTSTDSAGGVMVGEAAVHTCLAFQNTTIITTMTRMC
jgi:hypothetical protein